MSSDQPDLGDLLRQAQHMQEQLAEAQAAAAERVVEGRAGGGVVRVEVTGDLEFQSVHIEPEVVDPNDVAMLEDLVLAALHDAVARVQEVSQEALGGIGQALGEGLGQGLGQAFGAFGGTPGEPGDPGTPGRAGLPEPE